MCTKSQGPTSFYSELGNVIVQQPRGLVDKLQREVPDREGLTLLCAIQSFRSYAPKIQSDLESFS